MQIEPVQLWNGGTDRLEEVSLLNYSTEGIGPRVPVTIQRLEANYNRRQFAYLRCDPISTAIVINLKGSLMVGKSGDDQISIVPPNGLVMVRGGGRIPIKMTGGAHEAIILEWQDPENPILETFIRDTIGSKAHAKEQYKCGILSFDSISGTLAFLVDPATAMKNHPFRVVSLLYELSERILLSGNQFQLVQIPDNMPHYVKKVVKQVLDDQTHDWNLHSAGKLTHYTGFHFSRVFRTSFGYGFHRFVEDVRTEYAVNKMIEMKLPLEKIAKEAGFIGVASMKRSLKNLLGMTYKELPDAMLRFKHIIA